MSKNLRTTKKCSIFVLSKEKDMILTEKEKDLIEMIRNFRAARPNGAEEIQYYILQLLDELLNED